MRDPNKLCYAAPLTELVDKVDKIQADDALDFANQVSGCVARTPENLTERRIDESDALLTPEYFAKTDEVPASNCLGFSLITSELLSANGVRNYIIVANRHAMNLALDESGTMARVLNPTRNSLNCNWTSRILQFPRIHSNLTELPLGGGGRDLAVVHTDAMLDLCPPERRARLTGLVEEEGREAETWLDIALRRQHLPIIQMQEEYLENSALSARNHALYGTLTAADAGRKMLASMYNFWYLTLQKSHEAGRYLREMRGVWSEVDERQFDDNAFFLNEFLWRELPTANMGDFREYLDIAADSATELTSNLRVRLWRPDFLRKAATERRDLEVLENAREEYEKLYEEHHNALVAGKLAKTERAIRGLAK